MNTIRIISSLVLIGVTLSVAGQEKIQTEIGLKNDFVYKDGKIGIGTTDPTATLDVNGAIKARGLSTFGTFYGEEGFSSTNPVEITSIDEIGIISPFHIELNAPKVNFANFVYINKAGENVGIGTSDTKGYKLGVNGKIAATEVKIALYDNWPDFVFYEDYQLPTLKEVEKHIKEKGHLKDIPSEVEVKENGIHLGDMNSRLLRKIEELTLYTIQQEKKIEELNFKNEELQKLSTQLLRITNRLEQLESRSSK